jgi:hypothetical protein
MAGDQGRRIVFGSLEDGPSGIWSTVQGALLISILVELST